MRSISQFNIIKEVETFSGFRRLNFRVPSQKCKNGAMSSVVLPRCQRLFSEGLFGTRILLLYLISEGKWKHLSNRQKIFLVVKIINQHRNILLICLDMFTYTISNFKQRFFNDNSQKSISKVVQKLFYDLVQMKLRKIQPNYKRDLY